MTGKASRKGKAIRRRRRHIQRHARTGVLSNGNLKTGGVFVVKLIIYVAVGLATLATFGKGCATDFVHLTVRPMLDDQKLVMEAQREAMEKIGDQAEANGQAILNTVETTNMQWEWIKEGQQRNEKRIENLEKKVK